MIFIIIVSVVAAVLAASGKIKTDKLVTPLNILMSATFLSVFAGIFPCCYEMVSDDMSGGAVRFLKIIFMTFLNTIQVFTVDAGSDIISGYNETAGNSYILVFSVLSALAPLLTVGFLINFIANISASYRYLFCFRKDTYIFSELNERSFALAYDIVKKEKKSRVVFTGTSEEISGALTEAAEELGAICFAGNILSVDFGRHSKKSHLYFLIMNENDAECIDLSLKLKNNYGERENTELYIFSSSRASEMTVSNINGSSDHSVIRVRRINCIQSMIYHHLYEEGFRIFDRAVKLHKEGDNPEELIPVNAVIVGLGKYGTEMLKALSWYCQMEGYSLRIDAFDSDSDAKDKLEFQCPDLLSEKYNGTETDGESRYTINIHPGINITTASFVKRLKDIHESGKITYVFVALGSDEQNIETASDMRMIAERLGEFPLIQAVVYNPDLSYTLKGVSEYSGKKYEIDFIGDLKSAYSKDVIMSSGLENDALERHKKWGDESEFWKYEYNYRSSAASAIHSKAREHCGITKEKYSEEQIKCLEHCRWNAYMRAEGFVYSSTRNNLAKTHHNLVDYKSLNEEDKKKD